LEVGTYISFQALRDILVQLCVQSPEVVESESIEIKSWCYDEKDLAEKVSEAAACLANQRGGVLLVGVNEAQDCRRRFSQCPYPNVSPSWLEARVHDLTVPPVENSAHDISSTASEVIETPGIQVFALDVPRTKFISGHMTTKGLSRIRVGKECRPYYTAEDDRTRAFVPDLALGDLSVSSLRWAMAEHRRKFQTPEAEAPDPCVFLEQARLLDNYLVDGEGAPRQRISLAALILFGKESALARHLPFFETILATENYETRLRGNVVDCLQHLCASDRSRVPPLCPGVSRPTIMELLVNAYVHRCYRTPAPVIVRATRTVLEVSNPGELLGGLHPENLIHCVPAYRNLALADGARFVGICDKIGRGIDTVYESVLSGGFDFPSFESANNSFSARVSLERSREFSEFVRRRSQALSSLDEILALRFLWSRHGAPLMEVSWALQRSHAATRGILEEMKKKLMVERSEDGLSFQLASNVRHDIETIFRTDQMEMDLFGG
jgi:predicted HTH transcriptional regulator